MEPRTDQQSGRHAILVVDGDGQTRRLVELSLLNAGFDVRAVATAAEALEAIGAQAPELVVSEARFESGPDGFELCRQIKKRKDGAAIAFVFLAEQTTETKLKGFEAGADDFLGKPVYVQEVVSRARSLVQRRERDRLEAIARGDERFVGDLEDFPLVDLLGALGANHKSGVVVLTAPGGARGEIYFREGTVVDAEVGRLSGLDAVCRLFSWAQGRFEIEWKSIRRKDAVGKDTSALLVEALRRLDEWRRLLVDLPPLATIFEVDYHLLAERLAEIPDEVNGVLRLFDGQRTFIHVIDDSGLPDLDALAVIGKLFREQIIHDARAKPDAVSPPGADIEGWLTEAAGPFRAPATAPKRELFGASPELTPHRRATAPVEPLEEMAREPVVDERRERFTDRLIAEATPPPASHAPRAPVMAPETTQLGLPAPPPVRAPVMAPETTQLGLPAPPVPRVTPPLPMSASETTQQGIGTPAPPPLSTRPGFAAATVTSTGARVARELPVDVTPVARATPIGMAPSTGGEPTLGIPQPLAPQSAEPAIVIPAPTGATASRVAVESEPPSDLPEQRPVAGEIVSRKPTAKLFETDEPVKRTTDLGLGPSKGADGKAHASKPADGKSVEPRAFAPTAAAGEVVGAPAKVEEPRPARKIILDPEVPEEDDDAAAGSSRWVRLVGFAAMFGLIAFGVWAALRFTGRKRHAESDVVAVAETGEKEVKPLKEPPVVATPDAGPSVDAAAAVAVVDAAAAAPPRPSAPPRSTHHASSAPAAAAPVIEERMADPKVARALPTEFPQLLAACRQAFTEKRAKDAETACIAAKDANPDSAEACALLGHALFNRKKRKEALQWAERAIQLDPRHADAYVIIGGVKQAADDTAAAKAAYKRYLELAPTGQYAADLRAIVDSL